MKKALTLFAAVMLLASASFAQTNARRMTEKDMAKVSPAAMFKAQQQKPAATVATPSAPKNVTSFPWTEDFESGNAPAGFTFVDSDNDNYGWEVSDFGTTANGHNGSDYVITSASYVNNVGPLTPDNWMMLPTFDIPAGSDFELTWYEKGQDSNYADEFYTVYINTTGNAVANFTPATAVLTSTATGYWVKKTVSLASYAGQTIYIAFRHHNVTDMFYLDIDDMRIGAAGAPEVSVSGPAIALLNDPATFTATSTVNTLTWYVDGVQESATGLTLTHTFTTAGMHEVVAEATNAVGSAYDTLNVNVVDCGDAIDNFPYTENFEAANPCWLFVSADPANDDRVGITNVQVHEGISSFRFSSYASATSGDYNQFLISPEFDLPTTSDFMVKFWYLGNVSADAFRVKVSTTTRDTAAFTSVLADLPTVATTWTEVAYTLPAGTKYIAINYYGNYQYYLYIDAFSVEEMGAPSVSLDGPTTVGTNMPAVYTVSTTLADTVIWYVDGTDANNVGNVLNTTFTTTGNHEIVVEASNNYGNSFDTLVVDVFSCDGITMPYTPDFTSTLGCWSNRSDSTDGTGWFLSVDMFDSNPEGQVISMSAELVWGLFLMDVPVDNWLTSPLIEMPATGNYEVAWKVKPLEPDYAGDHYGVYLIADNTTTLLFEETLSSEMTDYVQRAAAIPSTVNGDFQIAFRHFNSEGGYVIILDEIQMRALTAPIVSIEGPANVEVNTDATFTAVSASADSFDWTVDGNAASGNGNTLTYTFTTTGSHTVAVTATNNAGTANATFTVSVYSCDIPALPYDEDFESASANCWQTTENFQVYSYEGYGHSGNGFLVGFYDDYADLDEWAISPAITLPADANNIGIAWYVRMVEYQGIQNSYELRVSTTGRNIADFTTILHSETGATTSYVYRGRSLANFGGQTIYLAFHNISPMGGDNLFIDDIHVGTGVGINDVNNINVAVYPNPASDKLNIEGEGISEVQLMDINGRTVMTANNGGVLSIASLTNGVYVIRVVTAEGVHTQKIVKQ